MKRKIGGRAKGIERKGRRNQIGDIDKREKREKGVERE